MFDHNLGVYVLIIRLHSKNVNLCTGTLIRNSNGLFYVKYIWLFYNLNFSYISGFLKFYVYFYYLSWDWHINHSNQWWQFFKQTNHFRKSKLFWKKIEINLNLKIDSKFSPFKTLYTASRCRTLAIMHYYTSLNETASAAAHEFREKLTRIFWRRGGVKRSREKYWTWER